LEVDIRGLLESVQSSKGVDLHTGS
jgi:hypothetical protein